MKKNGDTVLWCPELFYPTMSGSLAIISACGGCCGCKCKHRMSFFHLRTQPGSCQGRRVGGVGCIHEIDREFEGRRPSCFQVGGWGKSRIIPSRMVQRSDDYSSFPPGSPFESVERSGPYLDYALR